MRSGWKARAAWPRLPGPSNGRGAGCRRSGNPVQNSPAASAADTAKRELLRHAEPVPRRRHPVAPRPPGQRRAGLGPDFPHRPGGAAPDRGNVAPQERGDPSGVAPQGEQSDHPPLGRRQTHSARRAGDRNQDDQVGPTGRGHRIQGSRGQGPGVGEHKLAPTHHLQFTAYRLPLTAYRLPPTVYRLPFTAYRLPSPPSPAARRSADGCGTENVSSQCGSGSSLLSRASFRKAER